MGLWLAYPAPKVPRSPTTTQSLLNPSILWTMCISRSRWLQFHLEYINLIRCQSSKSLFPSPPVIFSLTEAQLRQRLARYLTTQANSSQGIFCRETLARTRAKPSSRRLSNWVHRRRERPLRRLWLFIIYSRTTGKSFSRRRS